MFLLKSRDGKTWFKGLAKHSDCEDSLCFLNSYPGIPTTIKTMGANITTIVYLRVLIIEIGSTIILMVVEAQGLSMFSMFRARHIVLYPLIQRYMNITINKYIKYPCPFILQLYAPRCFENGKTRTRDFRVSILDSPKCRWRHENVRFCFGGWGSAGGMTATHRKRMPFRKQKHFLQPSIFRY